ncbi:MAG: hypothetical protein QXZ33_04615, partial [Metallosphaera sp.]
ILDSLLTESSSEFSTSAFTKGLSVNVTTFRNLPLHTCPYVLPAPLIPIAHELNLFLVSKFSGFLNLRSVIEVDRYPHPVERPIPSPLYVNA